MKIGNKRIIAGIILMLILFVNYIGVQKVSVGVLPDNDDLLYPTYTVSDGDLNLQKTFFGVAAGIDRFKEGFKDLTYPEDEYRIMTSTQITSAYIRESLEGFSLFVYDAIVVCSYSFIGIFGLISLKLGLSAKRKALKGSGYFTDEKEEDTHINNELKKEEENWKMNY